MFFSRRASSSRFLEWKVRAFVVAIVLAFVGMYFEEGWMIGVGIAVLGVALLLRVVPPRSDGDDHRGTAEVGEGEMETGNGDEDDT